MPRDWLCWIGTVVSTPLVSIVWHGESDWSDIEKERNC